MTTRNVDKYCSYHTGSRINVQAKLRGTYGWIRMDGVYMWEGTNGVYILEGTNRVYIPEGKYTTTIGLNDQTYLW